MGAYPTCGCTCCVYVQPGPVTRCVTGAVKGAVLGGAMGGFTAGRCRDVVGMCYMRRRLVQGGGGGYCGAAAVVQADYAAPGFSYRTSTWLVLSGAGAVVKGAATGCVNGVMGTYKVDNAY